MRDEGWCSLTAHEKGLVNDAYLKGYGEGQEERVKEMRQKDQKKQRPPSVRVESGLGGKMIVTIGLFDEDAQGVNLVTSPSLVGFSMTLCMESLRALVNEFGRHGDQQGDRG